MTETVPDGKSFQLDIGYPPHLRYAYPTATSLLLPSGSWYVDTAYDSVTYFCKAWMLLNFRYFVYKINGGVVEVIVCTVQYYFRFEYNNTDI